MSEQLFGQRPAETPYERGYVDGEKFAKDSLIASVEVDEQLTDGEREYFLELIKEETKWPTGQSS